MTERTVDLWRYLPDYLQEFLELQVLFAAERPEFQTLVHNLNSLLDNLFINTATDAGLERFEQILHLYPNPTDTIAIRRSNVMAAWFSDKKYTLKTLLNRLSTLQQNENVQLIWDEDDNYLLHVITRMELQGQVDRLYEILEEMLPADIAYESVNYIEFNETFNIFYGVGLVGTGTLFLTDDFNETVTDDLTLYYAAGIVGTGTLFLTNDFTGTVEISGNAFVGMANGYTEIISTN